MHPSTGTNLVNTLGELYLSTEDRIDRKSEYQEKSGKRLRQELPCDSVRQYCGDSVIGLTISGQVGNASRMIRDVLQE